MKASITFFPNTAKRNPKSGRVPVYLRITFQRLKAETRLNIDLSDQDVIKWDPITMRLQERNSGANHALNQIEDRFQLFLHSNATCLTRFSAQSIKDHVLGMNKVQELGLMKFVDDYFERAVVNNVNCAPGTVKNYRRAINHLRSFLAYNSQQSISLSKLDLEFASSFKSYLVNANPAIDRAGMTEVSASTVIKKFRTIFSYAVELEHLKRNPFKLVKIKTKSPRKERLSIDQVDKIRNIELELYLIPSFHEIN